MDSGAIRRRFSLGAALLVASGLLAFAASGTAQAASGGCAGHQVRSIPFGSGVTRVYKRGDYVCAVTVARRPGAVRTMSVSVQARGSRPATDSGRYSRHAGPVTVHAGHRCVWIRGSIGGESVSTGWILC
ncbi:hypothetical protein SAMN04490357_3154 [Streptomyces misionensis]|uniref:Secreted protein n=1 Tax=Streptomyces misionensis TaxID=67331 RepID=A0A1H4W4J5_9ACTN|nr:hypothetical protein [Streptomyces misionensis]SEC88237.1 hypothetical protein SAMN04490357_3154 [Streptomyces misionensis]